MGSFGVQIKKKEKRQSRLRGLVFTRYAREKKNRDDYRCHSAECRVAAQFNQSRHQLHNYTSVHYCWQERKKEKKKSVQAQWKATDGIAKHLSLAFNSPFTSSCRWLRKNLERHPHLEGGPSRAGCVLLPGCSSLVFDQKKLENDTHKVACIAFRD